MRSAAGAKIKHPGAGRLDREAGRGGGGEAGREGEDSDPLPLSAGQSIDATGRGTHAGMDSRGRSRVVGQSCTVVERGGVGGPHTIDLHGVLRGFWF